MSGCIVGNISTNLEANFKEIYNGMSKMEAMNEANRCLYCYDAPCVKACPTKIPIPKFIKKIVSGNLKGSAKAIFEANPVGATCARVCPTEQLCEGACVLNEAGKPIAIGHLQRFVTDIAMKNDDSFFQAEENNDKKIAIIGSGPAGLSAARELRRFGYQVTIFEAEPFAGGLSRFGIVPFRLPIEVVEWEVKQVEDLGVVIKKNTEVGKDISPQQIMEDYDRIVLANGMGKVPHLNIEGESLKGVYDAIELVKKTKTEALTNRFIGKKVAVIGAGNTAIDAATTAKRLGASQVQILYRRTKNEMTAYPFEYDFALQDGVEFKWLTTPIRIIGTDQGVTGVECIKMKLGDEGIDGRPRPVPIEGSEFILEVDIVIKAIGQTRHIDLIEAFQCKHTDGVVEVNNDTLQTSEENIYACGDVIFGNNQGEAMVVTAAQQGKIVAKAIHQTFQSPIEIV